MILRTIARPLLASAFVVSGIDARRARPATVDTAQPLVDAGRDALPAEVAAVVPANAATAMRVNGGLQIAGGVLLATGRVPRVASAVLAGTLIPTTVYDGAFWTETDPVRRETRKVSFIKNLGLLGGVLIASADTAGQPSLAWRGRRKADEAKMAVAAALPIGAKAGSSAWAQMAERATDDAHALGEHAHEWGEAAAGMLDRGRDQAEAVAMRVADRAPAVFEQARYQAGELTGAVADRAPVVADQLRASAQEAARHVRCRRRNWRTAGA